LISSKLFLYFEKILTNPKGLEWGIPILLSPFSFLYCSLTFLNGYRKYLFQEELHENIIGIGNLNLGGSGKTPFTIALAKREKDKKIAIVLRGYGRNSKGTILISKYGEILESVEKSGDEAMLYSKALKNASVIVSENRKDGILLAKNLGAETIFLDDSYRHHGIKKRKEYLIISKDRNRFCLPAGGFREKLWFFRRDEVSFIQEEIDFVREVSIENQTSKMVLVTAIAKPERLFKYIDPEIPRYLFPDHYNFSERELSEIFIGERASSILVTEKDLVKLEKFNFPFSLLKLGLKIKEGV
jgi:tetraacyldisaccharide 4'-kinase